MYRYSRQYTGPVQAIIMDWAGTTVDFGSRAPIEGFQRLFASRGIELSEAEARGPMGTEKREHIRQLCELSRIREAWKVQFGKLPDSHDIDAMFGDFVPLQIEAIAAASDLIPGVTELLAWAKRRDIRIGANTGYAESMVAGLLERAAQQGYRPESMVCATQVSKGRPYPYMSLLNVMELGVKNLAACVKIDDTQPGIEEGLNAGMWTIALACSGNEVGLSLEAWQALTVDEQEAYRQPACEKFHRGGAHYVVDTIADAVTCLEDISRRLASGEQP